MGTAERKKDHIEICLSRDVSSSVSAGFEQCRIMHNALPELCLSDVDTSVLFLGKKMPFPLYISPITGGTGKAAKINENLAKAAAHWHIPICVGSQRAAIENPSLEDTFNVRKHTAGMVFANLGAVQLNKGYGLRQCRQAVEMVGADALVLHLNPLQEAVQPEGDTDFAGLQKKIRHICRNLSVPVIAKEVGHGISGVAAKQLEDAGVSCIDVAGLGGTSWAAVEGCRGSQRLGEAFRDWGIPTAECLRQARHSTSLPLIASGGIRTGIDVVKAVGLGASLCGIALPLLSAASESLERLNREIEEIVMEIRVAMFCCGARTLSGVRVEWLK